MDKEDGPSTESVHGGQKVDASSGSVAAPLYQTATFAFSTTEELLRAVSGKSERDVYTRWSNPTLKMAEEKLASLEEAEESAVFASGMAAISSTILTLASRGRKLVAVHDLYGETFNLFSKFLPRLGMTVEFVETTNIENIEQAVREDCCLLYIETPTNPTLKLVDIEAVARIAHENEAKLVVDNTFATPINQKPLSLGADVVLHSATKYLGGHSDIIAGGVAGPKKVIEEVKLTRRVLGGVLDPHAAWLLIRGMKTLALRVDRQNSNGMALAEFLSQHPKVQRVFYPGLDAHPQRELAKKQMKGCGGMVSFEVKGDIESARRVVENLRLSILAPSLGGVETLVTQPATTSHYYVAKEERLKAGITDELIRVSVGVEDGQDIIRDFRQALELI